jgi:hypothetical protein
MKALHAADLHIDSPMKGLVAYEEAPVDRLRLATRVALTNLVDAAIEETVDAVFLAGDIFDGDWAHYGTGVFFVAEMARLREADIPVVMLAGNHDADSKLTKSMRLPDNVRVLSTRNPETVLFESHGFAVHGQGYAVPAVFDDLSAAYPDPVSGLINIGLLHTSANGRPGHEPYAPCSIDGLVSRGYDFWGLGHVHQFEVLSTDPLIVFPGNLQGRGWREVGAKGAILVEVGSDGCSTFKQLCLDAVRWDVVTVDASGSVNRDEVAGHVAAAVRSATSDIGDRLLAARVTIEGVCDAHQTLIADSGAIRYEVIGAAADVAADQVWVESVILATRPPRDLVGEGADAASEIVREIGELRKINGVPDEISEVLAPLQKILPRAVLSDFDPLDVQTFLSILDEVNRSLPVALLDQPEV